MPVSDDLRSRLLLSVASEPGDVTTGTLVRAVGAAETLDLASTDWPLPDIVDRMQGELWRARLAPRIASSQSDRLLEETERLGLRILTPGGPGWPEGLSDLKTATPLLLWAKGDPGLATTSLGSRVSIVGARAATGYGEHVTGELAEGLADDGRVIVSGGAYGVDAAAHRAALAARSGATIAVLAGGLDRFYPAGNTELLNRVADKGLLLSEIPPGSPPTRWRFIQRNRLIAALSGATVVTEAGWRSGALNTAGHAVALGRPLGAVPGPITSSSSAGCHRLIHDHGARLVASTGDVLAMIEPPFDAAAARRELAPERLAQAEPPAIDAPRF